MSERFTYFSHIENLATKILVLTNPFLEARSAPLLCRYALHRQERTVLDPNPAYQGLARWHRLLPYERTALAQLEQLDAPLFQLERQPNTGLNTRTAVHLDARMPYLAAQIPLLASQTETAFALSPQGVAASVRQGFATQLQLWLPRTHVQAGDHLITASFPETLRQAQARQPEAGDLSAWGNPFRLEAWKCIGLELKTRHPESIPTLVVVDPCGELIAGLVQAAELYEAFDSEPPFRLIAVQTRPYHQLAQIFEGGQVDHAPLEAPENQSVLAIPKQIANTMISALNRLRGTIVVIDPSELSPQQSAMDVALARLQRAGFIDEEDDVYHMEASY